MCSLRSDESGFGTVRVAIVIVVVVLIGVVGFTVNKSNNNDKSSQANPTTNWVTYSDTAGQFSLRYPKNWVKAVRPDLCDKGTLLLGPNISSVGACGSENFGEISVISGGIDEGICFDLDPSAYSDVSDESVTVAGIKGKKETGVKKETAPVKGLNPAEVVPTGTKVVNYCFNTTARSYLASYYQRPTNPDALNDFNLMVTKTLQFTN
jgi:hypothetical protein